jgi:hypothetical protein
LKSGDTRGLNEHPLTGNRAGQWAVDIKGTGRGRGAGRVIFQKIMMEVLILLRFLLTTNIKGVIVYENETCFIGNIL